MELDKNSVRDVFAVLLDEGDTAVALKLAVRLGNPVNCERNCGKAC